MFNSDKLPEQCEPLFRYIYGFISQAEDESQLELLRGLIAQTVEDAREITITRLTGKKTVNHIIEAWRKKRRKELGYPEPKEPREKTPELDEEDKLIPAQPVGDEPDAALLEEPQKKRRSRPKRTEA